jgi:peroxiredoxin
MKIYIRRILITIGVIAVLFLVLRLLGNVFITEIVQEVAPDTYNGSATANIGEKAPFFELTDLNGNKVKLSDYIGFPTVITFWAAWNQVSADQVKIFDDVLLKNDNLLFKVITVNNQEDESVVRNFIKRGGYKIPVLLDEKGMIGELYKTRNLPATYFLDKNGVIRDVVVGILNEKMLIDKSEQIIH